MEYVKTTQLMLRIVTYITKNAIRITSNVTAGTMLPKKIAPPQSRDAQG
jgi:hypothetical protein